MHDNSPVPDPLLMPLVTPVLFLQWQVKISAVKKFPGYLFENCFIEPLMVD